MHAASESVPESALASSEINLLPLHRPESFQDSLRARYAQAGEFRMHTRALRETDRIEPVAAGVRACVVGYVVPKRLCKAAARRNLIRRVMREALRDAMRCTPQWPQWPDSPPVLVFRLTRKLPDSFRSAQSAPLRRYLREQAHQLLASWQARARAGA